MATLTNIPINARSMNGIITISDGTTVLEDGNITTTGDLAVDSLTCNFLDVLQATFVDVQTSDIFLDRTSTSAVNTLLGPFIDVGDILQNVYFDIPNRTLKFFNDNPANINDNMFVLDQANDTIEIKADVLELTGTSFNLYGNIAFIDSAVSFPNTQVSFDSSLPTTSITSGFNNNNFITQQYADTRYGELATSNAWTSTNTFNTNLPTSTVASSSSGTQFITRNIGDARFGQLAVANTCSLTNTFSNGIIPRRSAGDGTDLQISNNAMQYRQATSTNNIGIGLSTLIGDSVLAGQIYNTGSKNIAIGNFALEKMDGGSSCVAIGYQSMQNVSQQRIYGAGIFPSRCIAIGETTLRSNLYGNDQIAIGHNAMTNTSSGDSSICIGTNAGNGLTFQSDCVFIGADCAPTVNDNGITAIGALALGGAVGQFNSGVAIGYQSFYNNNNASANTGVGAMSGLKNVTGQANTCLGCFSGRFNLFTNLNSTTTIGYASSAEMDREFVIGGNGVQGDTQYLTLPMKNRINCAKYIGPASSYDINWRFNEYVVVNSAITTLINLPEAIYPNDNHVGACFHIIRTHVSYTDLTIAAFGTEKINYNGTLVSSITINNWVGSISFLCIDHVNGNGVWAVRGYQPRVTLATDANKIQTITDSTNVNYPMCFTTISNGINYFGVLANSNLTYNPSTGTINAQNINLSTALTLPANSLSGACLQFASIDPNKVQNLIIDGFANTFLGVNAGSNFSGFNSTAIGYNPLVSSVDILDVIAIGKNSALLMEEGSFSVFVGNSTAGGEITSASTKNTYIGDNSVSSGEHDHCSALGADTTINGGLSYSMALGYGVNCNASNQIKIGRNTETVEIDGNLVVAGSSSSRTFKYQSQNTLITAATTLTNPLKSYNPFTMKTNAAYTVTLPEVTASNVGTMLTFKRIGGFLHILTIAMSANQPAFLLGSSVGQLTSFSLCIATQTCGVIVAIQSQDAGSGLFSNAAGSTTVNITTQTSGTLSIGGIINLNGNIRRITGYSATAPVGNGGGTGNYIINTAIAAANTNAPYTSSVTYGWAVTSAQ